MENSLFFLLYYQGILNQPQRNIQYHYHLEYFISLVIYPYKDQDDHATFQFHHKVKVDS